MKTLVRGDTVGDTESTVVTVGNFDGVHLGHRALLAEVTAHASAAKLKSAVVTFEPHTRFVVSGDASDSLLTSLEEKVKLIGESGIDYIMIVPFDGEMSEKHPENFIDEILVRGLHTVQWVMGQGHAVGRKRLGNEIFLRETEAKYHFIIFIADLLTRNGRTVSSTRIRNCITQGHIAEAVVLLGHPYLISVERTGGLRLGGKLGYPTLNFTKPPSRKVIPPPGVYAAEMEYQGKREHGALYFGECPTLGDRREIHFEFHSFSRGKTEPAMGERAYLWLYAFIRKDERFAHTGELTKRIAKDINAIQTFFMKEKR